MSKRSQSLAKSVAPQTAPQEYRKPRADVYTVVLVVALLMILFGTAALWMTMKEYDYMIKGGPNPVWHRPAAGTVLDSPNGIA
ncbi:MAG: hypothetical protein ACLP9L_07155 [Thermoguttaceae bacterium]